MNLSSAGVEIITSDCTEELWLTRRTMCNFTLQHFYVNDCSEQAVLFCSTIGSGDNSVATHCLLQSDICLYNKTASSPLHNMKNNKNMII